MKKKVVFLPYDFDTALGINNEGALAFGYNLEDIDQTESGADVYNGQQSVLWKNMRDAFFDEMKEMYQELRSSNAISYEKVKQMFEEHQEKWPEAIFNDDAWFKYIDPLTEKGNASYLSMLQGSKEGQRNWWMYYRFRYLDSKYNAGDSLKDFITLRGYAKSNIKLTPYADIYPSVKFGSYLVQLRGKRGNEYEVVCPLDNVNDTEIYIYDASLLASVGDLSGLKVGYADFSKAVKLLIIKLGDASEDYQNGNLKEFYAGNNTLLHTVDLRNCNQLSQAVDLSGCTNIEYVYFDGTITTGIKLPNGGILKVLHLPGTITNLEILNQTKIEELVIPSYANIGTLRLENVGNVVDSLAMVQAIAAGSRVRIIGFDWSFNSVDDINAFYDVLDTMRGLDENGNNVDKAQLMGVIHVDTITGAQMATLLERYPNISIAYNHITSYLYYYNYDGTSLLYTESITDGGDGKYSGTPSRSSTAQYSYTFAGWSRTPNGNAESDARLNVEADRNVYAAYTATIRTYTVTFVNNSSGINVILQTVSNVPYGGNATYTGNTPVDAENGMDFLNWSPAPTNITSDTSCYAVFESPLEVVEISDSWSDIIASVNNGTYKTRYKVGNYKPIDLGSAGVINMQIAGFEKETLSDGSGNAPITWIAKELLNTSHRMNPALATDYDYSGVIDAWVFYESTKQIYTNSNIGNGIPSTNNQEMIVGCNFSITATDEQSLKIEVRNKYTGNRTKRFLNMTVSGIEENDLEYTFSAQTDSVTFTLTAGQTINISAVYNCLSNSFWYDSINSYGFTINLSSTTGGNFEVSNFTTDTANTRVKNGYVEGTGTIGGWEKCEMRTYLKETIKPLIPEEVRNAIKEVDKYTLMIDSSGSTATYIHKTIDDIWIPHEKEITGSNTDNKNLHYKILFPNEASRIRNVVGTTYGADYWLRQPYTNNRFYQIDNNGYESNDKSEISDGVLICFCM